MTFKKQIRAYEPIPNWYGVSNHEWGTCLINCHPIPFNFVVQIYIKIVTFLKCSMFKMGSFNDGYKEGFEDGKNFKIKQDKL